MHGRNWHDHDKPKDLEPEVMAGAGADTDVESSGEQIGVGRMQNKKTRPKKR